jgi:crotonobetainyl-CoA:carnitine CoA-transferase CaiB-like acyl-CoA transferase
MNFELPLSGVKVLDLTWHSAGPYCTRLLADYGADVIKIERPKFGDPSRDIPTFFSQEHAKETSSLFMFLNTQKRSLTLNLKDSKGVSILESLVRESDILVENFSPGVMESLGLGYEKLSKINPSLVFTSITNFGQTGPYKDWLGSDLVLYGMGGPMLNTGHPDKEPLQIAEYLPSFHVGSTAAAATSVSLWGAESKGIGDWLDINYFETLMGHIDRRSTSLLNYQYNGVISTRPPIAGSPGSGVWPTSDGGYFFTTVLANRFSAMARMIGAEHLLDEPAWATPAARAVPERTDEFSAMVILWMLEHTKKEIRDEVESAGVYGGPINNIAELLKDHHFEERAFFQEIDHPLTGPLTYPGYNFRIRDEDGEKTLPNRTPSPLLGQHTDQILINELGMTNIAVEKLRDEGVI